MSHAYKNKRKSKIDAKLIEMHENMSLGESYSPTEIADFCGCDKELIRHFERRALIKLRRRLGTEETAQLRGRLEKSTDR